MDDPKRERDAQTWQTSVWDRMSHVYWREIDQRFVPVIDAVIGRAHLVPGERVLDLGTGTGAAAKRAAGIVGGKGSVVGVDISAEMLALAQENAVRLALANLRFLRGSAEAIPAADGSFDVVLASLSLMFVIDRAAAARQIARVLAPGGRVCAAVWGAADQCDIVRFQQIAGSFAAAPPVAGVGPGALGDPSGFVAQLAAAGIAAEVTSEIVGFDFPDFETAWQTLAGVTAARLPAERQQAARAALVAAMYPSGPGPRHFRNLTHFISGRVRPS
jgi:SAM-dependent methyltransferase